MQLPELAELGAIKENLEQFLGINKKNRISDGEWNEMKNCTTDNFPLASSRKKRGIQRNNYDFDVSDLTVNKKPLGIAYTDNQFIDLRAIKNNEGKTIGAALFNNGKSIIELSTQNINVITDTVQISGADVTITCKALQIEQIKEIFSVGDDAYISSVGFKFVAKIISINEKDQTIIAKAYETLDDAVLNVNVINMRRYFANKFTEEVELFEPNDNQRQLVRQGSNICIFPDAVIYDSNENTVEKINSHAELTYEAGNRYIQFRTYVENSTKTGYKSIVLVDEATKKSATPDAEKYNSKSYRVQDGELQQWITTNNMWASVTPYTLITYAKRDGDFSDVKDELFANIRSGDTIDIVVEDADTTKAVWFDTTTPDSTVYATKNGQQGFIEISDGKYNVASVKVVKKAQYSDGRQYIVVQGLSYCVVNQTGNQQPRVMQKQTVKFIRKCPEIKFACVSQNRLWGCSNDGHEIYASALGDPYNFNDFSGIGTDSYAVTVGTDGLFTGCVNYQGNPIFFKENSAHAISGSYPEQYFVTDYTDFNGVQSGSERSLAIINNILYYKSAIGIVAFDGATTTLISGVLNNEIYKNATAGSYNNKYYVSMQNSIDGQYYLFVYDTALGTWCQEDNTQVLDFLKIGSEMVFSTENNIQSINHTDVIDKSNAEDDFEWELVTGVYGYSYPNNKYLSRFQLRMFLGLNSRAAIYIQYNSDGTWHRKGEMFSPYTRSYYFPIVPQRCDHLQIKIAGKGEFKLFSITKCLEEGGEI